MHCQPHLLSEMYVGISPPEAMAPSHQARICRPCKNQKIAEKIFELSEVVMKLKRRHEGLGRMRRVAQPTRTTLNSEPKGTEISSSRVLKRTSCSTFVSTSRHFFF